MIHNVCQRDTILRAHVFPHQASSVPVQQDHQVFQQSKKEYNIQKKSNTTPTILSVKYDNSSSDPS